MPEHTIEHTIDHTIDHITEYTILKKPTQIQLDQIQNLYRIAEWWPSDLDDLSLIEKMIQGSHFFIIAHDSNAIIGMGRSISDRVSDGYIQDVVVNSNYRNQGIGTQIVAMLIKCLKLDGIDWIGVIAENSSHPFYVQFGFEPMKNATPMILKE
jgi:aralkylamine N-acetyltransferase